MLGYIASSASSTAVAVDGTMDRINDDGVAGHPEVIIGAPDTHPFSGILRVRIRKFSSQLSW